MAKNTSKTSKKGRSTKRAKKDYVPTDWMQRLVDKQLQLIEQGKLIWQCPIQIDEQVRNTTGHCYRGVNVVNLMTDMLLHGWKTPVFITTTELKKRKIPFKQYKGQGVESVILRWVPIKFERDARDKDGEKTDEKEVVTIKRLKFVGVVWNIELFPELLQEHEATQETRQPIDVHETSQQVVDTYLQQSYAPSLKHARVLSVRGFVSGAYSPKDHEVLMSLKDDFKNTEGYYHTLFHEVAHSTGHRSILARKGIVEKNNFGSHEYSQEELVAEFCAAFLCAECGIMDMNTEQNTAAYLQSWAAALKKDKGMLTKAISKAQDAFYLVTKKTRPELQAQEQHQAQDETTPAQ